MKKAYSTILGIAISASMSLAQNVATPNPGFETWVTVGNYQDPASWHTLNASTAIVGVYTCTKATGVDVHSGTAAVKLTTKSILGIKANGFISTATPITVAPYGVTGGIPYSGRPDSIVGWYKNSTLAGDTAFIEFTLQDTITNTKIGYATFNTTGTHAAYGRFSVPITYYSNGIPNLSWWNISSSARIDTYRKVNSALFVDDINLIINPPVLAVTPTTLKGFSAVVGSYSATKTFSVSGNHLTDSVKIAAPAEYQVSLSATTGFKTTFKLAKNSLGILPSTTIYVRYKPTSAGVDSGYVKATSTGAVLKKVKVKGTSTVIRLANEPTYTATLSEATIQPNPVVNNASLKFVSKEKSEITVSVFDLTGNKISESSMLSNEGLNQLNIDASELTSGLYLCRIATSKEVIIKKMIKQ